MAWRVIAWEDRGDIVEGILENTETGELVQVITDTIAGTSLEIALN